MVSFRVAVNRYSSGGLETNEDHDEVFKVANLYQSAGGLLIKRCLGAIEIVNELFEPRLNDQTPTISQTYRSPVNLSPPTHCAKRAYLLLNNIDAGLLQYEQHIVGDSISIDVSANLSDVLAVTRINLIFEYHLTYMHLYIYIYIYAQR